jgi:hypothetical protein
LNSNLKFKKEREPGTQEAQAGDNKILFPKKEY